MAHAIGIQTKKKESPLMPHIADWQTGKRQKRNRPVAECAWLLAPTVGVAAS